MSSANKDRFISSFPITVLFLLSFLLIALARILNGSGESRHPSLVPDCRQRAFSLTSQEIFCKHPLSSGGSSLLFLVC